MIPRRELADELGINERTARDKYKWPTAYVGGVAYVPRNESLRAVAATVRRPPEPKPRGRRR